MNKKKEKKTLNEGVKQLRNWVDVSIYAWSKSEWRHFKWTESKKDFSNVNMIKHFVGDLNSLVSTSLLKDYLFWKARRHFHYILWSHWDNEHFSGEYTNFFDEHWIVPSISLIPMTFSIESNETLNRSFFKSTINWNISNSFRQNKKR